MIPVYSPNLPTEKVSAAVVGSVDPRVIRSLEALGVWTIAAGPVSYTHLTLPTKA